MADKKIRGKDVRAGDIIRVPGRYGAYVVLRGAYVVLRNATEDYCLKTYSLTDDATEVFHYSVLDIASSQFLLTRRKRWIIGKNLKRPIDEFHHNIAISPNGRDFVITAGCRCFTSFEAAADHWTRWRVENPRLLRRPLLNKTLNEWSLATLKVLRRRLDRYRASLKR